VRIDSLSVLQMSYMPFLNNGGLFISVAQPHIGSAGRRGMGNRESTVSVEGAEDRTSKLLETYQFNHVVCLVLQLPDASEKFCTLATVAWVTPVSLREGKSRGIGLQFHKADRGLRRAIESRLNTQLAAGAGISLRSQTL